MYLKAILFCSALLAALTTPSAVRADDQFTDGTCERATPVARHLNDLIEKNNTLTPEMMTLAMQMRDIYEDCVTGYDRDAVSSSGRVSSPAVNAAVGSTDGDLDFCARVLTLAQYRGAAVGCPRGRAGGHLRHAS